jgi:D-glycero-alpha-D-manno-heptose 1-phosphate guanylyltransferase
MSDGLHTLTAAILGGGQGTRLRSVVSDRQKIVASVAGRPFVMRLLDQLADAGLRRVVICTGYKSEQVTELAGRDYRGMSLQYSPEQTPLGTAGALRHALPLFESDPVLALNGDSFCETDLAAFWREHRERSAPGTMVIREVNDTRQSGRVSFNAAGAVLRFVEKDSSAGPGWINAGIYLLGRALLESIPADRPVSLERETFPAWIGRGLGVFPTAGKFLDIGTPESYAAAQEIFP